MTLLDLAGEIALAGPSEGAGFLPDGTAPFLVDELLAANGSGQLRPSGGLADALASTFEDLREAQIRPTDLIDGLGSAAGSELAALYEDFIGASAHLADRTRLIEAAARAPGAQLAAALPEGPLLLYGVYDLNEAQLQLVLQLAQVREVTAYVVSDDEYSALAFSAGLVGRLQAAGFIHIKMPADEAPPTIELLSAPDPQAEAEAVIRAVLDDIEAGTSPAEIAVLHHLDASQDELVESVIERAGLSCYVAAGRAARRTAAGKVALRLNQVLFEEPTRASLLELITSHQLKLDWIRSDLRPRPVVWERASKRIGLVRGWSSFVEALERELEAVDPEQGTDVSEWRRQTVAELLEVVGAFHTASEVASSTSIWSSLTTWWTQYYRQLIGDAESSEAVSAITARVEALAQLDRTPTAATPARFRRAVDQAVRRTTLRGGYFQRDGIFLGTVQAARGLRFRRVYLMDCAERAFPPIVRQDPILRDEERARLNAHVGRHVLPLKVERAAEERLLFELTRQAAIEKLTVSYARRTSLSGPPRFPSGLLLEELASQFGEYRGIGAIERESPPWFARLPARISFHAAAQDPSAGVRALDAFDLRTHALERAGEAGAEVVRSLWPDYDRLRTLRAARQARRFGSYDGIVPAELVEKAGVLAADVSATALADYVVCPYRFFLRSVLRVHPDEEPETTVQINPLVRGSLVHRVLERFVQPVVSGQNSWAEVLGDAERRLNELFDDEVARLPHGVTGLPVSWEREREALTGSLLTYLETERVRAEEGWSPIGSEKGFERVTLEEGGKKLSYRGAIDRIDRRGDRLRVVDYKTGRISESADGYRRGESLQLPLYIHAVARSEGVPVESISAEYHFVGPRGQNTRVSLDGGELAQDKRFGDMLRAVIEGIEAGHFFTWPGMERNRVYNCTFCDYRKLCHGDVRWHANRKQAGSQDLMRAWREVKEE